MQKAARTTALVIVPLGAAVSAHASTVDLPTSNFSCSWTAEVGGYSGSCSGGATQLAASNDVEGVALFTDGSISISPSGGSSDLYLSTSASSLGGTLPLGTILPVSWDFVISDASANVSWSLTVELSDSSGAVGDFVTNGETSGNGTVSGSGSLTTVADASTDVSLLATLQVSSAPGFEVSVPSGSSIDLESPAASAVPEPATTGLLAAALAWMGWRLRKVRRR